MNRYSTFKKLRWVIPLVMFVFCLLDSAAAQDTITLERRKGRSSKLLGEITEVSRTTITLKPASGPTKQIPVNEVRRVGLVGEPVGLRQARAAYLAGQFEQAVESLVEIDSTGREVLRQETEFYRVMASAELAVRGTGSPLAAEQAIMAFLKNERTTFHFFEAVEMMGNLASADGRFETASKYYSQIGKAPWPDYKLKSFVLLGDALRSQTKWKEAIEQFDAALAADAGDPLAIRQQTFATIGKSACEAELGNPTQAIETLEGVLAKNDETDGRLFAETYLALGAAYQQADQVMDAILSYLHIDLLFYKEREAHAEALFQLMTLWPKVDQPARGIESRRLLQQRYAGSVWAKRAN